MVLVIHLSFPWIRAFRGEEPVFVEIGGMLGAIYRAEKTRGPWDPKNGTVPIETSRLLVSLKSQKQIPSISARYQEDQAFFLSQLPCDLLDWHPTFRLRRRAKDHTNHPGNTPRFPIKTHLLTAIFKSFQEHHHQRSTAGAGGGWFLPRRQERRCSGVGEDLRGQRRCTSVSRFVSAKHWWVANKDTPAYL